MELAEQTAVETLMEQAPIEAWSAAEDLWRRLGLICAATASRTDGRIEIAFTDARASDWDDESVELIQWALSPHSYLWREEGRAGNLVEFAEMRGSDLVVGLTPLEKIAHWPDGQEIVCLARIYLMQIQNIVEGQPS